MSHIEQTIEELENQIRQKQKELEGLQIAVNNLCKLLNADAPPRYEIKGQSAEVLPIKLRGDEYFRKPTATAITEILKDRRARNLGPVTVDEIYDKMIEGGYVFTVKEPKRAIGTAMGKNQKFTWVNNKWGLTEWYGAPKGKRQVANEQPTQEEKPENEQEGSKETVRRQGRPKKSEQPENKQDEPKE